MKKLLGFENAPVQQFLHAAIHNAVEAGFRHVIIETIHVDDHPAIRSQLLIHGNLDNRAKPTPENIPPIGEISPADPLGPDTPLCHILPGGSIIIPLQNQFAAISPSTRLFASPLITGCDSRTPCEPPQYSISQVHVLLVSLYTDADLPDLGRAIQSAVPHHGGGSMSSGYAGSTRRYSHHIWLHESPTHSHPHPDSPCVRWMGTTFHAQKWREPPDRHFDTSYRGIPLNTRIPVVTCADGGSLSVFAEVDSPVLLRAALCDGDPAKANASLKEFQAAATRAMATIDATRPSCAPAPDTFPGPAIHNSEKLQADPGYLPFAPMGLPPALRTAIPGRENASFDTSFFIVDPNLPRVHQALLVRAATLNSDTVHLLQDPPDGTVMARPPSHFRITKTRLDIRRNALPKVAPPYEPIDHPYGPLPARCDSVHIHLTLQSPGELGYRRLSSDLAFITRSPECSNPLYGSPPVVARGTRIKPDELAAYLEFAFFDPAVDSGAESVDTQLEEFRIAAMHVALRTLSHDRAAAEATLGRLIQSISWAIPPGDAASLQILPGTGASKAKVRRLKRRLQDA